MSSVPQIQSIYKCWQPGLSEVAVRVPVRSTGTQPVPGRNTGLFFSLGVDSFFTLLRNRSRSCEGSDVITHILNVFGFDVYLWEHKRYPMVEQSLTMVAQDMQLSLLNVSTNMRDFSDQVADWVRMYHGAALASVALALPGMFGKMYLAAGRTYDYLIPAGSHPLLDPLWSTEYVDFIHDGCDTRRSEKLRFIGRHHIVQQTLRVCASDHDAAVYNCGACEKCVRTMLGLYLEGVLESCATLPTSIAPDLIRRISIGPRDREYYRSFADALGESEHDAAIKAALLSKLEGSE
jgi:hypothetical protein